MALAASAEQYPEAAVAAEREVVLLKVSCSPKVLSLFMPLGFRLLAFFLMQQCPGILIICCA